MNQNKICYRVKILPITCLALIVLLIVFMSSCSSAPKNPGDIEILRSQAEAWLESANKEAGKGNFQNALSILNETLRYATLADDSSLIIRVSLSRGNVLYSLGRADEAFTQLNHAIAEAERFKDAELISISKIYLARVNLISEKLPAGAVLEEAKRESANLKNNRLYTAFSWQAIGLAHRSLGEYSEAEAAFRRSLEIHERDRYLENASYDWYTIASIRSLAGNAQGALLALESSIALDRRIENSWGLAASYRAMGDIYRRAGRQNEAAQAYRRARSIYAAMGNNNEIAEIDKRLGVE